MIHFTFHHFSAPSMGDTSLHPASPNSKPRLMKLQSPYLLKKCVKEILKLDIDFLRVDARDFNGASVILRSLTPDKLPGFLDRFFDFHKERSRLDQGGIHLLHEIEAFSPELRRALRHWMEDDTTIEEFQAPEVLITAYPNLEVAKQNIHRIKKWPHGKETIPSFCLRTCTDCFKFLVRHELIQIDGYDMCGSSWFHLAVDSKNVQSLDYLINNIPVQQLNTCTKVHKLSEEKEEKESAEKPSLRLPRRKLEQQRHELERIELQSRLAIKRRYHPLVYLANYPHRKSFEKVWRRFNDEKFKLPKWVLNDELKLQVCSFVTPALAERLHREGFNIADAQASASTSWHVAAEHNPFGAEFMDWLQKRSSLALDTRDSKGHNALMHLALHRYTKAFPWLCKNTDVRASPVGGEAKYPKEWPAYAIRLAARSLAVKSPKAFKHLLDVMPEAYDEPYKVAFNLLVDISEALNWYRAENMIDPVTLARHQPHPTWDVVEKVCKEKCQMLLMRIPASEWMSGSLVEICTSLESQGLSGLRELFHQD